jgi:hypothetical protein
LWCESCYEEDVGFCEFLPPVDMEGVKRGNSFSSRGSIILGDLPGSNYHRDDRMLTKALIQTLMGTCFPNSKEQLNSLDRGKSYLFQ